MRANYLSRIPSLSNWSLKKMVESMKSGQKSINPETDPTREFEPIIGPDRQLLLYSIKKPNYMKCPISSISFTNLAIKLKYISSALTCTSTVLHNNYNNSSTFQKLINFTSCSSLKLCTFRWLERKKKLYFSNLATQKAYINPPRVSGVRSQLWWALPLGETYLYF